MNFDFVARGLNVEAAASELADISAPLWDAFTTRQTYPGSAHVDTKCIPLRGAFPLADSFKLKSSRQRLAYGDDLPHTLALVNRVLDGLPVKEVGNVLAVALLPGGFITEHSDQGEYAEHFERFHIVLTSKPGNWFKVDTQYAFPIPGDVFFFNHRSPHSVGNPSDEARIHLIVDVTLRE